MTYQIRNGSAYPYAPVIVLPAPDPENPAAASLDITYSSWDLIGGPVGSYSTNFCCKYVVNGCQVSLESYPTVFPQTLIVQESLSLPLMGTERYPISNTYHGSLSFPTSMTSSSILLSPSGNWGLYFSPTGELFLVYCSAGQFVWHFNFANWAAQSFWPYFAYFGTESPFLDLSASTNHRNGDTFLISSYGDEKLYGTVVSSVRFLEWIDSPYAYLGGATTGCNLGMFDQAYTVRYTAYGVWNGWATGYSAPTYAPFLALNGTLGVYNVQSNNNGNGDGPQEKYFSRLGLDAKCTLSITDQGVVFVNNTATAQSWSSVGNLYTPPFNNQPLPFIWYNEYVDQPEVSQDSPYVMLPNYTLNFQSFTYDRPPVGSTFACLGPNNVSRIYGVFGDSSGLNVSFNYPYSIEGLYNAGTPPITSVFASEQCALRSLGYTPTLPDPTELVTQLIPGLEPSQYTGEIQLTAYSGQCLQTTGDTTSNVLEFSTTSQQGSSVCSPSYYNFFQTYFLPDHDSTLTFSLTPPFLAPYASFWTCLEVDAGGQLVLQKVCSSSAPNQRFQVNVVANDTSSDYYDAAYTTDYGYGTPVSYYFSLSLVDTSTCMTAKGTLPMFVPCDPTDTTQWFTITRSLTMKTYLNTTSDGDETVVYFNDTNMLSILGAAFDGAVQKDSQGIGYQLSGTLNFDNVYGIVRLLFMTRTSL
jgi:hypothetical protein